MIVTLDIVKAGVQSHYMIKVVCPNGGGNRLCNIVMPQGRPSLGKSPSVTGRLTRYYVFTSSTCFGSL